MKDLSIEAIKAMSDKLDRIRFAIERSPEVPVGAIFACACVGPIPECKCARQNRLISELRAQLKERELSPVPSYTAKELAELREALKMHFVRWSFQYVQNVTDASLSGHTYCSNYLDDADIEMHVQTAMIAGLTASDFPPSEPPSTEVLDPHGDFSIAGKGESGGVSSAPPEIGDFAAWVVAVPGPDVDLALCIDRDGDKALLRFQVWQRDGPWHEDWVTVTGASKYGCWKIDETDQRIGQNLRAEKERRAAFARL